MEQSALNAKSETAIQCPDNWEDESDAEPPVPLPNRCTTAPVETFHTTIPPRCVPTAAYVTVAVEATGDALLLLFSEEDASEEETARQVYCEAKWLGSVSEYLSWPDAMSHNRSRLSPDTVASVGGCRALLLRSNASRAPADVGGIITLISSSSFSRSFSPTSPRVCLFCSLLFSARTLTLT